VPGAVPAVFLEVLMKRLMGFLSKGLFDVGIFIPRSAIFLKQILWGVSPYPIQAG